MGFMFKQVDKILTLQEVDTIAANFWGVEVDSKYYAAPSSWGMMNWFDVLGMAIEDLYLHYHLKNDGTKRFRYGIGDQTQPEFNMNDVAAMVLFRAMTGSSEALALEVIPKVYKDFIELCYHMKELGITAVAERDELQKYAVLISNRRDPNDRHYVTCYTFEEARNAASEFADNEHYVLIYKLEKEVR
jgi:hypothetical protein